MKKLILSLFALLLSGCVTPDGDTPSDPSFAITPSDLAQADWVQSVVARTPGAKYRVQAGSQSITVTFDMEITKEQEATVRENMVSMKSDLERQFRKANTLIFKFRNVELKQ